MCAECYRRNIIKLGGNVDHIIPAQSENDPLFWDPTNHQNLCDTCHSVKTAREDGGFGNVKNNRPHADCTESGIPIDDRHHWNDANH